MAWIAISGEEADAIQDLYESSDRATAIIAASLVEARLKTALERVFQRSEKIEGEMFRSTGPLGSFSAKIHMAFLINLISHDAHKDLSIMKDVRNRFAHHIDVKDFKSQRIKDWCGNFSLIEKHFVETKRPRTDFRSAKHELQLMMGIENLSDKLADPRWRYLMTAMLFTAAFVAPTVSGRVNL